MSPTLHHRTGVAALLLAAAACAHSEPFSSDGPDPLGPPSADLPRQLTFNAGDDRSPQVTGDVVAYSRYDPARGTRARCIAASSLMPSSILTVGRFMVPPIARMRAAWMACKNRADGHTALAQCEVACDACGRCVVDAAPGLIRLEDHLAVIDYAKNELAARAAIERCPTGAIVWVEDGERAVKGATAKKILRQSVLPLATM